MSEQIRIGVYTVRRVESNLLHDDGRPVARIQIVHENGEGGDYPEEDVERYVRRFVRRFF